MEEELLDYYEPIEDRTRDGSFMIGEVTKI
jgi:hypothetical protein